MEIRKVVLVLVAVVSFGVGWFARGWATRPAGVVPVHLVDLEFQEPTAPPHHMTPADWADAEKRLEKSFQDEVAGIKAAHSKKQSAPSRSVTPAAAASSHP